MSVKSGLGTDPVVGVSAITSSSCSSSSSASSSSAPASAGIGCGSSNNSFACASVASSGLAPKKKKRKKEYAISNKLQEGRRPVYAVCFNFIDARYHNLFATAGGNRVTVYHLLEGSGIAVLQTYVDDNKDEAFYTVSWACNGSNSPLLTASGSNGVIRVIDAGKEKLYKSLVGHGDSINELRTQALNPCLVASASKDESVRLWNVNSGVCILILAGSNGHRNEVLSVDFHPSNKELIASCGMDNSVKIWSLKEFWVYVEKSFDWKDNPSKFQSKYVQFPILTASVHSNYVDCTRWLGDCILSKSVDNEVVLWEASAKDQNGNNDGTVDVLQKYPVPDCDIWFIKFSCDFNYNSLAIGNREGKVYVWELQTSPPQLIAKLSCSHCKSPIRQTAMSFDGSTILCSCEDGSIWRWDVIP